MAGGQNRVNIEVGFSLDKSGLTQMQSLFQQITNSAKEPGNQLNTGLQKAASTANTLDQILTRTFNTELGTLNVTKFNQELNKSGLTLKTIKSDLSAAGNQGATAYNRLTQAVLGTNLQLKQTSKLLDSMADTFTKTVKWGIASSVFNNISNAIKKAYTYTKQLDTSLNDIRIVTDKSAENMDRFAEKANSAAKELGASTLDYTNAALIYYQQGLSDEEANARAETTIKAANVTGQTGREVSEQLTAVWNGYKVTAAETELYVDKLAAVAATTAADLEELSVGMSKVAAAANAMGVDFDDLNAQIATIVSVTRQAPESVGTALKTIYARLGDLKVDGVDEFGVKLGEVSKQMETMGIQILDENGDLRAMSNVIAEVAEKWDTWTRAQQQAAAVAMAGKRQYNNLVALFENWDMYSDALETSANSMGTLQHQQDIYMESTEAKLNTLKATWQDLYKGIIDKDEIDTGINALTNLVQVFDNFFDSFGGGLKSIAAFGTIVANIFNQQIARAINEAIQRQEIYKQNLQAIELKNQSIQNGTMQSTGSTIRDESIAFATEKELAIAKQIYEVRTGLSTQEYNSLTNLQQEVGQLAEKQKYEELYTVKQEKEILNETTINQLLKKDYDTVEEIINETQKRLETQQELLEKQQAARQELEGTLQTAINLKSQGQSYGGHLAQIYKNVSQIGSKERIIVENLIDQNSKGKITTGLKKAILDIVDKQIAKQEKLVEQTNREINSEQNVLKAREKIAEYKEQELNIQNKINAGLEKGKSSIPVTQSIIATTSALSSMAMAWSSVRSIIQTLKDDTASFGDKVTQIFMSLGPAILMTVSSFKKLNETFGFSSSILKAYNAFQAKKIALDQLSNASEMVKMSTMAVSNEEVKEAIVETAALATDKELEAIATNKNTAALMAENVMRRAGIVLEGADLVALRERLVALAMERQATLNAAKAQAVYNTTLLANPAFWVIGALTILTGVIAGVIGIQQKRLEQLIEINDKEIERVNKIQEEIDANEDLYNSYNKLYTQYKNNEVEKEALYDVTDDLCEKYDLEGGYLAKLTGEYSALTEEIRNARTEELEYAKAQTLNKVNAAEDNLVPKARKKSGYLSGDKYTLSLGTGASGWAWSGAGILPQDEQEIYKYLSNISSAKLNQQNAWNGMISGISFDVDANNPKEMVELYDELTEQVNLMRENIDSTVRNDAESFTTIVNWLSKMEEPIQQYRESLEELDNYTIQLIANQIDFTNATSLEEFQNKVIEFKNALEKADLNTTESIDRIADKYINSLDTAYGNIYLGLEDLKKQVDNEAEQYIDSLTKGQKEYLLSGKVDLRFVQTKEDIEAEMQKAFDNTYGTFDVTSPISLAGTLASGTKLKKKDNQILGDLEGENPAAMAGFDNKSVLNQLETIDKITDYRIAKNEEYLRNTEEVTEKSLKIREREREELLNNQNYQRLSSINKDLLTEEELAQLNEYDSDLKQIENDLLELNRIKQEGLSFYEVEDIGFNSFISSIEMATNKAEALQNAAELIGEGFTVAASDVEKLADIFPELLEGAQQVDGALQLSPDTVQQTIEGIKAEMEARNAAKIAEIDQQIELKELEQTYLKEKLKNLQLYLEGKQSEQSTIDAINQAGFDYENNLMKLTGEEITGLTNHAIASSHTEGSALVNMIDQVGKGFAKAAKAHYAMIHGQPFEWGEGLSFSGFEGTAEEYSSAISEKAHDLYLENQAAYEEIFNQAKEVEEQLNVVNGEIDELKKQKAVIEATGTAASHALDNVMAGKAGKDSKSKSGGGKDKKDKDDKEYKDEFDRYWEIKKAIDAVDRALSKLDKDQENLYGYELIKSLKLENELLEQQAANYRALAEAQKQEAAELQGVLSGYGVAFDASGAITNYAAATAAALQQYNDAIHQYNMGLIDESTLGVFEKNYEKFKKALERYDTLFYTEMKETEEKLDEIRRKELANNLKAWQVEIELKLNMKELERQWNDFITKVQKDFQKVYGDLRVDLRNMLKDAYTYTGSEGTIATIIKAIQDVTGEIDKMRFGGTSDMFESISQAQEELKKLNDQLLEAGEALHDLWEQAWDNYLDGIDQVADQFDDLIDRFERINDELDFQGKLIELIYGEEAYGLMDKLYKGQEKNTLAQIDSLKQQRDMWEQLFYASGATLENQTEWDEDQKKYYDEWMEAQSDLNNLVLDYIELLKTDYLNTVKDVLKQFDAFVSGSSLAHLGDQWDRIADRADKYYDSVEGAYEVQSLANKMDQSIANETNLKTQQKLQALRDKEIQYLREKENLTEYDLQAAEARFQIALKEAALEDARNNKTSMKLTRNEQGNWSYQYIADEGDVANKQQDLLEAYNQLYQLASDAYEANLEALLNLQQTYLDKAQEIATSKVLTDQEKKEQLLELARWYEEEYNLLAEENTLYRNDLQEGAAALLLEIYNQDQEAYTAMTETEKELLDALIAAHVDGFLDLEEKISANYMNIGDIAKQVMEETRADWTSGAQTIADLWNADDGFSVKNQILLAYEVINQASIRYKELVDQVAIAVGRDFSEEGIAGAIMRAEQETDNLSSKTVDLVNTSITYLNQLRAYVDQIAAAWRSVQQAIMDAIGLIQEYLKYIGDVNAAAASGGISGGGGSGNAGGASPGSGNGSGERNGSNNGGQKQYYLTDGTGAFYGGPYGSEEEAKRAANNLIGGRSGTGLETSLHVVQYATGGYTGEWNSGSTDGRLAVLHQKELVLNETDTSNFLKGINTLRDMSSENGSIESAILKSVANVALNLGNLKPGNVQGGSTTTNDTSNIFNIQAEFPNANNVNDIREAILSLPNLASQRVNLNLK